MPNERGVPGSRFRQPLISEDMAGMGFAAAMRVENSYVGFLGCP